MKEKTEVLVVGGGVIGAAILFELAQRGVRATLVERGRFAGESTGKSAAIVRTHYSNRPVVRMALRSREIFSAFEDVTGTDAVYFERGWGFLVPEDAVETVSATAIMNRDEGVDVVEIAVDASGELYPGLSPDGIGMILFEPRSGYANPHATTLGYVTAARRLGAQAREGVDVQRLLADDGGVRGVVTGDGTVLADRVVLAAGPWSAKLAQSIELQLPYRVTREEELYLDAPSSLRPQASMSSLVDRIYLRPLSAREAHPHGVIVGRGYPKDYDNVDPDLVDESLSGPFERDVRERLKGRLPDLAEARTLGSVVGLYAVTPDWHPYLGAVDGVEGLVLATGGSGHCFKLAPAIGEMVADSILGEQTEYADIDLFNVRRVEQDRLFAAAIGGNRA